MVFGEEFDTISLVAQLFQKSLWNLKLKWISNLKLKFFDRNRSTQSRKLQRKKHFFSLSFVAFQLCRIFISAPISRPVGDAIFTRDFFQDIDYFFSYFKFINRLQDWVGLAFFASRTIFQDFQKCLTHPSLAIFDPTRRTNHLDFFHFNIYLSFLWRGNIHDLQKCTCEIVEGSIFLEKFIQFVN